MVAKAAIRATSFKEIHHLYYSPDMTLGGYYCFQNLKIDFRRRFSTESDLKEFVLMHFENKISEYFYGGIKNLINKCRKCIEIERGYSAFES